MAIRDWAFVSFVACFTALGGCIYGHGIGSMNGLQNFAGFLETFELGEESSNSTCSETSNIAEDKQLILGAFISVASLGTAVGNLLAGKPADYFGRKITLVMSGVLIVLGGSIQSAAVQGAVWMLIAGRLIAGLGYGVIWLAGPLYVAEIAPKNIRGRLTSLFGPAAAMGIMTGYVTNFLLYNKSFGWRVSRIMTCVLGLVYFFGMILVPKSPRWLMLKGRESEAREVLIKTVSKLGQEGIESELEDIRQSLNSGPKINILQELNLILKWRNLKRVLMGAFLHMFAAACGTAIFFYSEPLFCSLGIVPFVTALVIGGLTLCGTTFTTIFIDKLGRKPMLVGGGLMMFLLTGTAATLVYAFNLEEENDDIVSYIVVCLICLFMLVYSSTWYIIPWIVTSEMFSLEGRGIAVAISTAANSSLVYSMSLAFPSLLASIQTFGSLYMFSVINLAATLFVIFFLPETKGITLEQMEKVFAKPWLEMVGLTSCYRSRCYQTRNNVIGDSADVKDEDSNAMSTIVVVSTEKTNMT
ncbi:uncharacterized protein LOC135348624 [Halichondria panicea]|uniref:uncharacterized protein LOC135348624 n=1 Tax=Halichondria panicea TaxID=6063 RepID=UPI00312B950A